MHKSGGAQIPRLPLFCMRDSLGEGDVRESLNPPPPWIFFKFIFKVELLKVGFLRNVQKVPLFNGSCNKMKAHNLSDLLSFFLHNQKMYVQMQCR